MDASDSAAEYYQGSPLIQNYQINDTAYTKPLPPNAPLYATLAKYLLTLGLVLCLLFCLAFLGVIALHFGFETMIQEGITQSKIIINGSDSYDAWLSSLSSQSVPQYESIILFNLTNPRDVLQGAIPIYTELPSLSYRKHYQKFAISQSRDNETITYRERVWYEFDEKRSQLPRDAIVTNISPSYLAVMQQIGSESKLRMMMIGSVTQEIMKSLINDFVEVVFQAFRAPLLQEAFTRITTTESVKSFCEHWSNGEPEQGITSLWRNMTLRIETTDLPVEIPLETCRQLWDSNHAYALNEDLTAALEHATLWVEASHGAPLAIKTLLSTFEGLTEEHLTRIFTWLHLVYDRQVTWPWVHDTVLAGGTPITQRDLFSPQDLGLYQWGQGAGIPLFPGESVQSLLNLPGQPEIFFLHNYAFDIPTSRRLVELFNQENVLEFLGLFEAQDYKRLMLRWGLTKEQLEVVAEYLDYVARVFVNDTLEKLFANQQGFISTRTADEWIVDYDDPLLNLLGMGEMSRELLVLKSYPTEQEASTRRGWSIISTGVSDLSATGNFIMDDGNSALPWVNEDGSHVHVRGTDGTQFQNNLDEDSTITIWFDDALRAQDFVFTSHESHEGIDCMRFMLADYISERNTTFHNGFLSQSNMTILGAPVFIGKWRFYGSEPQWTERVHGVGSCEDRTACDTVLDVEPHTGLAMFERKRVQYNVHLPQNSTWLDTFHVGVSGAENGTLYPIAMIEETAEITPELASQFKEQLTRTILVRDILYWVLVTVCLLCFVLGGTMTLVSFAFKNKALGR